MAPSQGSGTAAYRAAGEARRVGSSQQALLEALASRGVEAPAVEPPVYRPWRGRRRIEVTEAELEGSGPVP